MTMSVDEPAGTTLRLCLGAAKTWLSAAPYGTHLVHLTNHAIPSAVNELPEQITSPSFSRFSSSMTTTNSPFLIAATASGTESNLKGEGTSVGGLATSVGSDIVN